MLETAIINDFCSKRNLIDTKEIIFCGGLIYFESGKMKSVKIGYVFLVAIALVACSRQSSVSTDTSTVQISAGAGGTPNLKVSEGNASVTIGDVQQNQNGIGQHDLAEINSAGTGQVNAQVTSSSVDINSVQTGDGRSVTVKDGQVILHREGQGSITLNTDQ